MEFIIFIILLRTEDGDTRMADKFHVAATSILQGMGCIKDSDSDEEHRECDAEETSLQKAILASLRDLPLDKQEENESRTEGQEQVFCTEGHPMALIDGSEHQDRICDLCGNRSSVGEKVQAWRCDQVQELGQRMAVGGCDFDICNHCIWEYKVNIALEYLPIF